MAEFNDREPQLKPFGESWQDLTKLFAVRKSTGDDVPAIKKALAFFRRASDNSSADALYKIGEAYSKGQGMPKDPAQAVLWWRDAAARGHAQAMMMLSVVHTIGVGVPKDLALAKM